MTKDDKKKARDGWNDLPREYRVYLTKSIVEMEIFVGNISVECTGHKIVHKVKKDEG